MKEDQPVKCGHRAILQRFTIAIARYIMYIYCAVLFIYCLAVFIITIKSPSKRAMVTVVSGGWPRLEGTIAPRSRILTTFFLIPFQFRYVAPVVVVAPHRWIDNFPVENWEASWSFCPDPSWTCGSSSTASLRSPSRGLRTAISRSLAQSSGDDDVKPGPEPKFSQVHAGNLRRPEELSLSARDCCWDQKEEQWTRVAKVGSLADGDGGGRPGWDPGGVGSGLGR